MYFSVDTFFLFQVSEEVKYQCVHCVFTADRETITVIAELPLIDSHEVCAACASMALVAKLCFLRAWTRDFISISEEIVSFHTGRYFLTAG